MSFVAGKYNGVSITPTGFSNNQLRIMEWSWEERVEALITTHSLTNGIADKLAGILDGEGSVIANIWALQTPADLGIYAGNTAMIYKRYVSVAYGAPKQLQIPVLIQSVPYKSSVAGLSSYEMRVTLAASVGTYNRALAA